MISRRPEIRLNRGRITSGNGGSPLVSVAQSVAVDAVFTYVAGAYSPADEGNLIAWFDMLDATAYTLNGGSTGVTQVKNKVSGVQWASSGGADIPYDATGWNGHPCLHPTGLTHYLMSTEAAVVSAFDCPNTRKPYTLVVFTEPDVPDAFGWVFAAANSANNASARKWGQNTTANGRWVATQLAPHTTVATISASADIAAGKQILQWHSPGSTISLNVDAGADLYSAATLDPLYVPGVGPNRVAFFCNPDAGPDTPYANKWVGALIYSAELDAAALTRIRNWANARHA